MVSIQPADRRQLRFGRRLRRSVVLARQWLPAVGMLLFALSATRLSPGRSAEPAYPSSWDGRLVELAGFVEKTRQLTFRHPVAVRFLDEASFRSTLNSEAQADPDGARGADHEAALLRALGLAEGPLDLTGGRADLITHGVAAYYDAATQEIVVPDGILDPYQRTVLVHELTHALQDQRFGLDRQLPADARSAWLALVEGDASRIERAYAAGLPTAERDALDDREAGGARPTDREAEAAATPPPPSALTVAFEAPYALGEAWVTGVADREGNAGVDRLFAAPPASSEAYVDPVGAVDSRGRLPTVTPVTPAGVEAQETATLGPLDLVMMIEESSDLATGLRAGYGWGNAAYQVYRDADVTCVALAARGDDDAETAEIEAGLRRWAASAPPAARRLVERRAEAVLGWSCDPGPEVPLGLAGRAEATLRAATWLNWLSGDLRSRDEAVAPLRARCAALAVVTSFDAVRYGGGGPDLDEMVLDFGVRADAALAGPCAA